MTPSSWRDCTIADIAADERNSLCIGPFGSDLLASDLVDEGVPVVFVRNVRPGRFEPKGLRYVTNAKAQELRAHRVRSGDLVITKMGLPPCIAAAYPDDTPDGVVTADIIKLTPDLTKVDARYVVHFLNSPLARSQVERFTFGVTRPKVTLKDFRSLRFTLPPLAEQRRIADILDKADAIRRKRKEAIALTEELLRSAFLEMFGDPVTNSKGWEVKPLSELLSFLTSGSRGWAEYYSDAGDTFLRIQNVRHDRLDLSDVAFVRAPDSAEARRTLTVAGDVLLSITADLGRTAVVPEGMGRAFINQHLAILRPEGVHPEYLSSFLASDGGQRQFRRLNKGGVKAGLNFNDIRSVQVPLPSRSLQTTFAEFKRRVRRMESTINRGLEEADRLFDSLVHLAFRGELGEGNRRSRPLRLLEEAGL